MASENNSSLSLSSWLSVLLSYIVTLNISPSRVLQCQGDFIGKVHGLGTHPPFCTALWRLHHLLGVLFFVMDLRTMDL